MGYVVVPATETSATSSVLYGVDINFQQAGIFTNTPTIQSEAVSQFKNLLLTYPGEHYMKPNFGCDLKKIIFEPNVYILKDKIVDIIEDAVSTFCPFINIEQINIVTGDEDPTLNNDVLVKIYFTVGNSSNGQQITVTGTQTGNVTVTGG